MRTATRFMPLLLAFSAMSHAGPAQAQTLPVIDYFPSLKTGNNWTYATDVRDDPADPFFGVTGTYMTPGTMTIHGANATQYARTSDIPGDVGDGRWFSVGADGLRMHREDFDLTLPDFEAFAAPATLMPAVVTVGQTYSFGYSYNGQSPADNDVWAGTTTGSAQVVGFESVTVPAGTFNALRIDFNTAWSESGNDGSPYSGSGGVDETWWLAQGVGIVRSTTLRTNTYPDDDPYVEFIDELTASTVSLRGDFNGDSAVNAADVDLLLANLGGSPAVYDLTGDNVVDSADFNEWVGGIKLTAGGDTDLDRDIDDTDLGVAISSFTGPGGVSQVSWSQGNTDGDNDVDDTDLGVAISNFTGPLAPATVPEPATMLVLGALGAWAMRRQRCA